MSNRARSVNDGDWICGNSDCANINFSWRTKCNKCGKEKSKVEIFKKTGSEIGKKAAEKSGGLFSADDWHCSSCGNVNWARRMDCNVCNTPKFGTVEPRTGLGGGYNERENVEYVQREESDDDEFDEFGRRNKKFRAKTGKVDSNPPQEVKTASQEKFDEADDSGEEFDLSKYDLADGDGDGDGELSKYDLSMDSPDVPKSRSMMRNQNRARSPKSSKCKRSSRSRSHSPAKKRSRSRSRSRDVKRHSRYSRSQSRDRSRSPAKKRKSRSSHSRSRSRDGRNSRSCSWSRERYSRRSRSNSREKTRDRRAYRRSYSRSRSRSRDRRRGRSRSRERYR